MAAAGEGVTPHDGIDLEPLANYKTESVLRQAVRQAVLQVVNLQTGANYKSAAQVSAPSSTLSFSGTEQHFPAFQLLGSPGKCECAAPVAYRLSIRLCKPCRRCSFSKFPPRISCTLISCQGCHDGF